MMRRSFAQRWSRRLRHWSRALAVRWLGGAASLVARKDVSWCPHRAPLMASAGRTLRRTCCARCAPPARALLCRRDFSWRRPPAGRRSGYVMTAGLNSSRV
ncbi:hypothetical protein F511_47427 [Dorcoceras hygrometricum]|uniref:Secreted protein n=1 Tax=Dorcoceras hygrometricum TaxID=472368 RepID=A0A2Z6ZRM2_9LAMI|nr:hypothetical protein F511_47427 [Dorcoceras hygrometricum]